MEDPSESNITVRTGDRITIHLKASINIIIMEVVDTNPTRIKGKFIYELGDLSYFGDTDAIKKGDTIEVMLGDIHEITWVTTKTRLVSLFSDEVGWYEFEEKATYWVWGLFLLLLLAS